MPGSLSDPSASGAPACIPVEQQTSLPLESKGCANRKAREITMLCPVLRPCARTNAKAIGQTRPGGRTKNQPGNLVRSMKHRTRKGILMLLDGLAHGLMIRIRLNPNTIYPTLHHWLPSRQIMPLCHPTRCMAHSLPNHRVRHASILQQHGKGPP